MNQSLSGTWNVASVSNMLEMFYNIYFNQSLNDWNVASVNDMAFMFYGYGASYFNESFNDWNVASVNDMISMFRATKFNQYLSTWADTTPPKVFVNGIFRDSGCPNKDAVATVGLW